MAKTNPPPKTPAVQGEAKKPPPPNPLDLYPMPPDFEKRMGRPPSKMEYLNHNHKAFEHLMQIKAPLEWCAQHFFCDPDTIARFVKQRYGCTFTELRGQKQNYWRAATFNALVDEGLVKRTPSVLIFCGKNLLGWSDNPEPPAGEQDDNYELEFVDAKEAEPAP